MKVIRMITLALSLAALAAAQFPPPHCLPCDDDPVKGKAKPEKTEEKKPAAKKTER
ncbi:MAG: hypothetical protein ACK5AZ_12225 [Bryobacteraceae bacterium]